MEDSGIFSVKLKNDGGEAKCSANLIVEGNYNDYNLFDWKF